MSDLLDRVAIQGEHPLTFRDVQELVTPESALKAMKRLSEEEKGDWSPRAVKHHLSKTPVGTVLAVAKRENHEPLVEFLSQIALSQLRKEMVIRFRCGVKSMTFKQLQQARASVWARIVLFIKGYGIYRGDRKPVITALFKQRLEACKTAKTEKKCQAVETLLNVCTEVKLEEPKEIPLTPVQRFFAAIKANDLEAVKAADRQLLAIQNEQGEYPLHAALKTSSKEVVQELLKKGANVNARSCAGETSFHVALTRDPFSEELALAILDKKPNVADNVGLLDAVLSNPRVTEEVVLKFLDLKPPIKKPLFDGLAPLAVVFQLEHLTVKVVEKLLALGASPTPTLNVGEEEFSLLFGAMLRSNKYEKLPPLLKYRQPVYHADPRKSPFHFALRNRLPRNICEALARQCPINVADENGKSPLEVALDHNHIVVARVLIERGADVLKKDVKGQQLVFRCLNHTALQQALLTSHPHLATTVFADGTTLLYRSAKHAALIDFVNHLLELGAAPEQIVPKIGKSCLELIKSLNTPDLVPMRRLFEQNLQTRGLAHAH